MHGIPVCVAACLLYASLCIGAVFVSAQEPKEPEKKSDAAAAESAVPTLEGLLKAGKFPYVKRPPGEPGSLQLFDIINRGGADPMIVTAYEQVAFTDSTGKQRKVVVIVSQLIQLTDEKKEKPPVPMLIHLSVLNDRMEPGKIVLWPKLGVIAFESSFWLAIATPDTLRNELTYAAVIRPDVRKEIAPYLKNDE